MFQVSFLQCTQTLRHRCANSAFGNMRKCAEGHFIRQLIINGVHINGHRSVECYTFFSGGGGGGKLGTLVGKLNLTRKRNSSGRGPNFI